MTQIVMDLFIMKVMKHRLIHDNNVVSVGDLINAAFDTQNERKISSMRWLIGSPEIKKQDICFQFGKTSTAKVGAYDNEEHKFLDKENTDAHYTNVYVDPKYQVVGIFRNSKLPKTEILAKRIAKTILHNCGYNSIHDITIEPLFDTAQLVKIVDDSHAVTAMVFEATRPNPWYADDFSKHIQDYVKESNGDTGKVAVYGPNLDKGIINRTIRKVSLLGHKIYVRIREKNHDKPIIKKPKNILNVMVEKASSSLAICKKLRQKHLEIKGENTDDKS